MIMGGRAFSKLDHNLWIMVVVVLVVVVAGGSVRLVCAAEAESWIAGGFQGLKKFPG